MTTCSTVESKEEQVMLDRKRIRHNLHMMYLCGHITRGRLEYILKAGENVRKEGEENSNTTTED